MRNAICWVIPLILGCSGGEGTSFGDDVDAKDPSAFCRAGGEMACTKMYSCLTQAERDRLDLPATEAECQRAFEADCERGIDNCSDETHGYASAAAGMCLDQMDRAQCNDAIEPWLDAPACKQVCARTAGAFELRWRFEPFHTCSELLVSTVSVISRSNGKQFVDTFPCEARTGVTSLLPVGTYSVRVELHDPSGERRWADDFASDDIDANIVDLGELVIPVSP